MAKKRAATNKAISTKSTSQKPRLESEAAPLIAPGSPRKYRVRVRMYRQGLGDCFLLTFPRHAQPPFQILIDCGALLRDAQSMTRIVEHIRDTVRGGPTGKAKLDVVVATHEHKDHLSGFNQARSVFDNDFDFGAVWLGWTENLAQPEIKAIKQAKKKALTTLREALASPLAQLAGEQLDGVAALLAFSEDDPTPSAGPGSRTIAEALEYLKSRGREAGNLRFFEPGTGPIELAGVEDLRVFVLGPPRDPSLLKASEATEKMKKDKVIYHLTATGPAGMDALSAALYGGYVAPGTDIERRYPFGSEHRIAPEVSDPLDPSRLRPNPYYDGLRPFLAQTYDDPAQAWRRIDNDWLSAFGQLALDLDNDTNNTSLVLAFEFGKTREVLLFVADAQVGNWQSWDKVGFKVPERENPLPAHDLLSRTVFYKVGHHCSHNGTLKKGGLELMVNDDLVAFIPLDRSTAAKQGPKDPATGKPKGWEMPAKPLYDALQTKAKLRVFISDVTETVPPQAAPARVFATNTFIDYFLK